jgi:hypothetical protein
MKSNIIHVRRPVNTGRYLNIRKRGYSHTDIYHPVRGFLARLVSRPEGFQVTSPSNSCHHMVGTFHQTPSSFERKYLRGAS